MTFNLINFLGCAAPDGFNLH